MNIATTVFGGTYLIIRVLTHRYDNINIVDYYQELKSQHIVMVLANRLTIDYYIDIRNMDTK